MSDWYKIPSTDVVQALKVDPEQGLSAAEAASRLEQHGPNELIDRGTKSPWKILLEQFAQTLIVVLIIASVISFFLGETDDAIVVMIIVVLNALLGFRQEYQAEKSMAALKKLAVPSVRVRRGGHIQEVSAVSLVPGDLVLLEAGNLVPADCRLVESSNLRVQEAALTGESEPVSKEDDFLPAKESDLPLAERHNMVYLGTAVTYGRAQALVTETGMHTELGAIAELMQSSEQEPTPLQRRLDQLGKGLAWVALALVGVVFGLGMLRGEDVKELFLTSISMAVAAVPEGLPAVVTISLALGAQRMLKRRALIRKLPAVEALGSVTVICSDKTGTLTENRMTVTVLDIAENHIDLTEETIRLPLHKRDSIYLQDAPTAEQQQALSDAPALSLLLVGGTLCNDAILESDEGSAANFRIVGDPTEGALVVAGAQMGLVKGVLEELFPRVAEVPFDSERKRMTTVHRVATSVDEVPKDFHPVWLAAEEFSGHVAFTKGAMDGLLEISSKVWDQDHAVPMNDAWRKRLEAANERLAQQGMRVLGVAFRHLDAPPQKDGDLSLEQDLTFVGLFGMIDPARGEVKDAVQTCRTAGIRPVMITGDHPLTAGYIARELGIAAADGKDRVLTGQDLERISDSELLETVEHVSVYARVSPEHKLRIVQALQARGEIAAMTGDGVNDAPALKKANIGVAMGITGTDVSKEAADMVLLDDNFATIVAAVREGRVIYDNIRKFIQYTLTSNAGEIWVMLAAPFLGMPLPLSPIQILWINLVTDGLPGLALSVEPGERDTMQRRPYPPNENVFARGLGSSVLWIGALMGFVSLLMGFIFWQRGSELWHTAVFTTLTLSEMGYVMAIRSRRDSLFSIGIFSNLPLLGAVVLTTLLQLAVIYVPFLQDIFETQALPLPDLLQCIVAASTLFFAVEIQKWVARRSAKGAK